MLALAPSRNHALLKRNRIKSKPHPQALVVLTETAVGRHELRVACWQVCTCSTIQSHHAFCEQCENRWAETVTGKLLRVQSTNQLFMNASGEVKGTYSVLKHMYINQKLVKDYELKMSEDHWLGPLTIQPGDTIVFQPNVYCCSRRSSVNEPCPICRAMEFQVVSTNSQSDDTQLQLSAQAAPEAQLHEQESNQAGEKYESQLAFSSSSPESPVDTPLETQPMDRHHYLTNVDPTTTMSATKTEPAKALPFKREEPSQRSEPVNETLPEYADGSGENASLSPPPYMDTSKARFIPQLPLPGECRFAVPNAVVFTAAVDNNMDIASPPVAADAASADNDAKNNSSSPPRLYFVKCKRYSDMHIKDTRDTAMKRAKDRGAVVLSEFDPTAPPTHFIVGQNLKMNQGHYLIRDLKFESVKELHTYMTEHHVQFARLRWVMHNLSDPWEPMSRENEIYRMEVPSESNKRKASTEEDALQKRYREEEAPDSQIDHPRNKELIELFTTLSKLYREGPLEDHDLWRAYTFNRAASVIRNLSFGITIDSVNDLKKQQGLKDSCVQIAKEFLETRRCKRLIMLQTDAERIALRTFTRIWGAGPVKAKQLLSMGYRNITDLRQATAEGKLLWKRNEYLGLKYYDDINDEMDRSEAKKISDIVISLAKSERFYPTAEAEVMGSYRRNKESCGDVDFIITDPGWGDEVPPAFLGSFVDKLREDGFVLHHLTLIRGMNPNHFETIDESEMKFIEHNTIDGKRSEKKKDKRSYTWMGIFRSPVHEGRVRRVDIKAYPYTERIFASIYFTGKRLVVLNRWVCSLYSVNSSVVVSLPGNGHFNRAMRFWSKKQKRYQLDDHGLWEVDDSGKLILDLNGKQIRATGKDGKVFEPTCEKDVFDFLGLEWREPHERDGLGALRSKDKGDVTDLPVSQSDIFADSRNFSWVE